MKSTIKAASKPNDSVSFFVECKLHRHTIRLKTDLESAAYDLQDLLEDVDFIEVIRYDKPDPCTHC